MPVINYLSVRELATKYPVDGIEDPVNTWNNMIVRWKRRGELDQSAHMSYRHNGDTHPCTTYHEPRIVRLIAVTYRDRHKTQGSFPVLCTKIYERHWQVMVDVANAALPNAPNTQPSA